MTPASSNPEPLLDRGTAAEPLPWFVPLGALLLYYLRFGYHYATSDQGEILPFLFHRLDPSLLANDWFVQTQVADFSIRTYFVMLLEGLSLVMPVWTGVLLGYIAAWLALATAVYRIAQTLTLDRVAAVATVVLVLVLTPQWTLGGNDLVTSILVPSMAAWALALWGVVFFLRSRLRLAALLLGIATCLQMLVGLQIAGLLGVLLLLDLRDPSMRARRWREVLIFSGIYLACALPALGPLVYQQATSASVGHRPTLFYILAAFRNPHHYLFLSFSPRSMLRFGMVLAGGLAALWLLQKRGRLHRADFVKRVLTLTGLFGTLAFFLTEITPVLFVAKLQLFKYTVFAKLLLVGMLCGAGSLLLPTRVHAAIDGLLERRWLLLIAVLLAWSLTLTSTLAFDGLLRAKAGPLTQSNTPEGSIAAWARTKTPRDALFAVPPSWSGFRSQAQRALVVDFKAFPFQDAQMFVWFERLYDLAPLDLPERGGPDLMARLDSAFVAMRPADRQLLVTRYAVDFLVLPDTAASLQYLGYEKRFEAGAWWVWHRPETDETTNRGNGVSEASTGLE